MRVAAFIFASLLAMAIASAETTATAAAPVAEKKVEKKAVKTAEKKEAAKPEQKAGLPTDVKSLVVEDLSVGKGKVAQKGKTVKVHYTGWLYEPSRPDGRGRQFDSSVKRGEPFAFPLGAGQVIKGWDEGFKDMKVGGRRKLIIPSEMGYGAQGAGHVIPPNATLMFEVELIDVMDVTL